MSRNRAIVCFLLAAGVLVAGLYIWRSGSQRRETLAPLELDELPICSLLDRLAEKFPDAVSAPRWRDADPLECQVALTASTRRWVVRGPEESLRVGDVVFRLVSGWSPELLTLPDGAVEVLRIEDIGVDPESGRRWYPTTILFAQRAPPSGEAPAPALGDG